MASTSEKARVDQIVGNFFAKSLHVILEGRIPALSSSPSLLLRSSSSPSPSSSSARQVSSDHWFSLEFDNYEVTSIHSEPWSRSFSEPMIVDILLQQQPVKSLSRQSSSSSVEGTGSPTVSPASDSSQAITLLERWVVKYDKKRSTESRPSLLSPPREDTSGAFASSTPSASATVSSSSLPSRFSRNSSLESPVVYKHAVIMLRSLYATLRLLPAHRVSRLAASASAASSGPFCSFSLAYRVSPSPPPLSPWESSSMSTRRLTPVETPSGHMSLSVAYLHTTAVTALEVSPAPMPPRIITDYVSSPAAEGSRNLSPHFPSPSSSPSRPLSVLFLAGPNMTSPCSAPTPLPCHGPKSGAGSSRYPSPTVHKPKNTTPRPPSQLLTPKKTQISFPSHFLPPNSATLPLIGPKGGGGGFGGGRGSWGKQMRNNYVASTGGREGGMEVSSGRVSGREREREVGGEEPRVSFAPHSLPRMCSAPVAIPQKVPKTFSSPHLDGQGITRQLSNNQPLASTRKIATPGNQEMGLRMENHLEDDDVFALPFAVDDEEIHTKKKEMGSTGTSPSNPFGQQNMTNVAEYGSLSASGFASRQSQDAAVGALVRTLRTAAPLRSGVFYPSPSALVNFSSTSRVDIDLSCTAIPLADVGRKSLILEGGFENLSSTPRQQANASMSMSQSRRTSAEVLEELKQYTEIKQALLRQSGGAQTFDAQ